MKKFILLSVLTAAAVTMNAAELPEAKVQALPSEMGWFDAFVVTWADVPTQPYRLQILDPTGISVTKNMVEDLAILDVSLVEYQEDEDTPNYENARLVVTLNMLEAEVGSTYSLLVPAGTVNVYLSDSEAVPNEEVTFSFQLKANGEVSLPEPDITPEVGEVSSLNVVKMSWMGVLGSLDLLNSVNVIEEEELIDPITFTYNDGEAQSVAVSFEWSNRLAMTDGAAGDILVLTLTEEETLPEGEYVINIPSGYLQISDIETGTLYNDEIILGYKVVANSEGDDNGGVTTIIDDVNTSESIYNLNGVKQSDKNLSKGIYIINNKKVVVR